MYEYYCQTCEKWCEKDEVELEEGMFEGDWVEIHLICNSRISGLPTGILIR